jgi:DNA-directed RNA polymerase sigma subunit (sigma70/sigma32)
MPTEERSLFEERYDAEPDGDDFLFAAPAENPPAPEHKHPPRHHAVTRNVRPTGLHTEETDEPADSRGMHEVDTDDSVSLYLKEIGRVPLLTAEEEIDFARRIERGRLARYEYNRGCYEPMRREELVHLMIDGQRAQESLIKANSRLVVSVAKKIHRPRRAFP